MCIIQLTRSSVGRTVVAGPSSIVQNGHRLDDLSDQVSRGYSDTLL